MRSWGCVWRTTRSHHLSGGHEYKIEPGYNIIRHARYGSFLARKPERQYVRGFEM